MTVENRTIPRTRVNLVDTFEIAGITNSNIGKIHKVPAGATIKAVLVSAGTGSIYSTSHNQSVSVADDTVAKIEGTGNAAEWDEWADGDVTATTSAVTTGAVETVTLAPTSGEWILQVSVSTSA